MSSAHPAAPALRSAARWPPMACPSSPSCATPSVGAPPSIPIDPVIADLTKARTLKKALRPASIVVSCAHARHIPAILDASPASYRFVFLGSTRKYTQWPDDHAWGVLDGEEAFRKSDRFGVVLHPTMIYGSQGEDNVQRLAKLLARLPVVPLPWRRQRLGPAHSPGRRHPFATRRHQRGVALARGRSHRRRRQSHLRRFHPRRGRRRWLATAADHGRVRPAATLGVAPHPVASRDSHGPTRPKCGG